MENLYIYLFTFIAAFNRVSSAPMICTLPFSSEKGQCVHVNDCLATRISSELVNPDTYENIKGRSLSCALLNSKMVCCEVISIDIKSSEPVPEIATTTTTTTASTTTQLTPENLNRPITQHVNYKLFDTKNCGLATSDRIAYGEDAALLEFPWAAQLGYRKDAEVKHLCGASLITDFYVITAAHCLIDLPIGYELNSVRLGEYDTSSITDCVEDDKCSDPLQDVSIDSYITHPNYNRRELNNDIGLVRMASAAKKTQNNIKPICLPFNSNAIKLGMKYTVIGWGRTENNETSVVLQKAFVPEFDSAMCELKFNGKAKITSGQICAGGEGKTDACRGDSGSSLQMPTQVSAMPQMVAYGIVSYGVKSCGKTEGIPGVYTRVSEYLGWILNNMH